MNTDFIIVLDPELADEETGEIVLIVSKIDKNSKEKMEFLGAFTGNDAKEVVDIFFKFKEENKSCKGCAHETGCYTKFPCKECTRIHDDEYGKLDYFVEEDKKDG